MGTKIMIMLMFHLSTLLTAEDSLVRYETINCNYKALIDTDRMYIDKSGHYVMADITRTELQKYSMEHSPHIQNTIYCNTMSLKGIASGETLCAIGKILSGNIMDYNLWCYIFAFDNETVLVWNIADYDDFFLEAPMAILKLFYHLAQKNGIDDITGAAALYKILSLSLSDNLHLWQHPVIPVAYNAMDMEFHSDGTWIWYERHHDYSTLKSFLYDHFVLGIDNKALFGLMSEYISYCRERTEEKKDIVDKNILIDIMEMLTMASPPSAVPRSLKIRRLYENSIIIKPAYSLIIGSLTKAVCQEHPVMPGLLLQ